MMGILLERFVVVNFRKLYKLDLKPFHNQLSWPCNSLRWKAFWHIQSSVISLMEKELLQEADYLAITSNQTQTIEELDKTNLLLANTNELSNKFVGEAIHNFRKGVEAISRIKSNLDEIHKALLAIKRAKDAQGQ